MAERMEKYLLKTKLGFLELLGDENGLAKAVFTSDENNTSLKIPKALEEAVKQLNEYFVGNRTGFNLKLNPKGTDFQMKVWQELEKIPFGKTKNYQEIANNLGNPKVIRAAASANGKNPIAIIIPCHRVIGSDGSLTGYAGGIHRKKWLLEHESPVTQGKLF